MVMHNSRSNLLSFERAKSAAYVRRREALARQAEPIVVEDARVARTTTNKRKRVKK